MITLDFVIGNNNGVYIKQSPINGSPETCGESDKGIFTKLKAENILRSLPKTMRKMRFKVICIPDVQIKTPAEQIIKDVKEKNTLKSFDYSPSENVTRWIERFGTCGDIIKSAENRYVELESELKISDTEIIDILHSIELSPPKDLYGAYLLYRRIRNNRRDRRQLKDEMKIIHNVLEEINSSMVNRERTQKAIDGLFDRKYSYRIVDEEDNKNDL